MGESIDAIIFDFSELERSMSGQQILKVYIS